MTKNQTTTAEMGAAISLIAAPSEVQGSDRVFSLFKEKLSTGELRPGQRLLPERELAQRFGVSRASLREAMRSLTMLGVIEIRPGQGAFVTAPDATVLRDFFGLLLAMQPSLYENILEARIAIECQAVRLACQHADKVDLERLEKALSDIQQTVWNDAAGGQADFEFHNALIRASHNEILLFIHEALEALVRRNHLERRRAVRGNHDFLATLADAHRDVIDAIIARDPDQAELVVRKHFTLAQDFAAKARLLAAPESTEGSK